MTIDLTLTRDLYGFFYQLAFGSFLIVLIVEGIKRKYPLSTWLLLTAFVSFCLIIGSKLNTSLLEQIRTLSFDMSPIDFTRKSAINGFVLGILGLWLVRRYFAIKQPVFDAFAITLPVMMLFQRMGCLMAGCCYGTQTDCGLGIHYKGISSLLDSQIDAGLLSSDSFTTLSVHPVPLYYIASAIITIGLLVSFKNRFKQTGSLALFSFICMMFGRFVVEFFRDPTTNYRLGTTFTGLQMIQWILLPLIILGTLWLVWREQKEVVLSKPVVLPVCIERNVKFIVFFSLFVFILRKWLTTEEIGVLHLQISISALLLLFSFRTSSERSVYRFVPTSTILLSFMVMGFTYNFETENKHEQLDSLPQKRYLTGSYRHNTLPTITYPCTEIKQGCFGSYCSNRNYSRPFGPTYNSISFGLENAAFSTKRSQTITGISGELENYYNKDKNNPEFRGSFHMYLGRQNQYEHGIRLGLRVGNIYRPDFSKINNAANLLPTIRVNIGYQDYFSLQGNILDSDLVGSGSSFSEVKLSTGLLTRKNPKIGTLGLGYGLLYDSHNYYYLQNEITLMPKMMIKPSIGLMTGNNNSKLFYGSLGIRYNLPTKK